MNRRNYSLHFVLAGALVVLAAAAGRIERWEGSRVGDAPRYRVVVKETAPPAAPRTPATLDEEGEPEALVRFKPGVSEERMQEIAASLNDRVEDEIESVERLTAIDDLDDEEAARVAEEYASRAEADISAFSAWDKTKGSRKVVVAVLDSGVDYTHPDLAGNMWHRPADLEMYLDPQLGMMDDSEGFSAVESERDPMDENGHGTHCSGIVGAEGDNNLGIAGVNWQVEIMPLKFMGRGGFGSTKDAIEAINYVIARKQDGVNVRVISASWGSQSRSKALEDVIRKAGEADILFVAAAGNDGADADKRPHYPSGYKLPNVLSVAALDRRDELTSFSNYGAKGVHVAAPGKEILSTWLGGGYEEHSGTSMATPFVAGVAGLVLSVEPKD